MYVWCGCGGIFYESLLVDHVLLLMGVVVEYYVCDIGDFIVWVVMMYFYIVVVYFFVDGNG